MTTTGDEPADRSARSAEAFRYWAFISYSHRDEGWATWLHRKLEGYGGHAKLVATDSLRGEPLPRRLFPVFRDRDELAGAPDLSERVQEALRESRYLVVICSPNSAKSKWVNEEIKAFKRLGGEARVLAFIIAGEPNASDDPGSKVAECFPEAIKYRVGSNGTLTSERTEPIAADARKGADGKRNALLKVIAGILGVHFDALRRRDQERAARRRNWITAGALTGVAVFACIAAYAYKQQLIAEERSRTALSRQLAAQALNELPGQADGSRQADYARGLLLAVQALHTKPTTEARAVLLKAVLSSPHRLTFLWNHDTRIMSIAFAPDGKVFATAGADGSLMLWDSMTRQPTGPPLAAHKGGVTSLAFSSRDDVLASGGKDAQVRLWKVTTRQSLGEAFVGPRQTVNTLAFSPDGTMLASGGGDNVVGAGELFVWELSSRQPPRSPASGNDGVFRSGPINSVAFSPDGKTLVSASLGNLVVWDTAGFTPLSELEGHQFTSIAFNVDGTMLASGGHSRVGTRSIVKQPYGLLLWDLAGKSSRGIASPQEVDDVGSVAFSRDNVLASGSRDGRVMLWTDLEAKEPKMQSLSGHRGRLNSVTFSPDGRTLASASADGTLILRDLKGGAPLTRVLEHAPSQKAAASNPFYKIHGLALSSDGKTLASTGPGGKVIIWDPVAGIPRRDLDGIAAWDMSLAFTPDARTLAAATEKEVILLDVVSGERKGSPIRHSGAVDGRSFTPDSKIVALKMPDHSVLLWDIAGRTSVGTPLSGHKETLSDLGFSPDGKVLASGSADGVVILWDVANRRALKPPMADHGGAIQSLTFSPDGKLLALVASSGPRESSLTLWDLTRGERADLLPRKEITLDKLRFSPDGKLLVAAVGNGELLLWDVANRSLLGSLVTGSSGSSAALAFTPESDILVSADAGVVTLWDVVRRSRLGSLVTGHSQGIGSAAFSNDANVMFSSGLWGSKLIAVDLDPASWAQYACQAANRDLTENEWRQYVGSDLAHEPACLRRRSPEK